MNQQIHEEAAEWLVELQGQPDAATRQRFDQWLATSPEHVRAYLECTAIVEAAAAAPRGTPREIEELIARAEQSSAANVVPLAPTHATSEAVSPQRDELRSGSWLARSSRFARLAAAAMVLVTIGATLTYVMTRNVYTTAVGEHRSILLSDGSTIDLNGRSSVRVRMNRGTRAVDLREGEALFRVAADKARPFVVSTQDARVRAVGTEFSVNRRVREVLVTVVEGTVAVSAPTIVRPTRAESGSAALSPTANEILVGAGQQLALSRGASVGPPQPRAVDVNDAIAWTRRRLVFDSTPIEDVVAEFNRHSTRELVIQGSGLQDFHISGAFSSTDVEPLLRFLRTEPGVEVIEEPDRIVIVHR
jgi:transmembrane sensor